VTKRRSLAVVSAGLGQPSSTRLLADRLAAETGAELHRLGVSVDTEVIELRDLAHDVVNNLLAGFPSTALKNVLNTVADADGLIAVSATFNASYSGLFKSFFDVFEEGALADKPVLLGATGGTARHSLMLEHAVRPMFSYLRSIPVPTAVYAAAEDWGGGTDVLRPRIERAGRELAEMVAVREPRPPRDPFALTTSFEDLLP
jgi:FMN reductase